MKPDEAIIKALIEGITRYNNAKTADEGSGALGGLIGIGEKLVSKPSDAASPRDVDKETSKDTEESGQTSGN